MKKTPHSTLALLSLALSPLPFLHAQAVPAATAPGISMGFQLPSASGTLHYGLSVSERATLGYEGQNVTYYSTNFSGSVGYLSQSEVHPFSLIYTGGYLVGNNGEPSSQYHDLAFSQVFSSGKWNGVVGDSLAYLPESAAGGLSGIPGLGDANLPPGQLGTYLDQSILNRNVSRISNVASGSITRQFTASTGLTTAASFGVDRFLGNSGNAIDDNNYSLSEGLNHRIDARTSVGLGYGYGRYSYSGSDVVNSDQTLSVHGSRQVTRRISVSGYAGPQWIYSNSPLIPSQLSYAIGSNATYAGRVTSYTLGFSRGTAAGSGIVTGSISNALNGGVQHRFGRAWQVSANGAYIKSRSLATGPLYNANFSEVVGGVQVNRGLSRNLSAFLSYTAERQLDNGSPASSILFNGLSQTIGFGITFSPESIHVGHR